MNNYLIPFFSAFLIGVLLIPLLIPFLHKLKFGQTIRQEGLASHYAKAGTPTMGGIVFYAAAACAFFVSGNYDFRTLIILALATGHGILGFADDYIKAVKKDPEGLQAKTKLFFQFSLSILFLIFLALNNHSTQYIFPLFGALDFSFFYWIFALLYLVFFSNAVNIIDGVDGLCSGQSFIALIFFALVAFWQSDLEVLTLSLALMGVLLAFFLFNRNPAKIFMGDTGSLGLGFALAAIALLLKTEVLAVWVGLVFVVDIFSSVIQVIYFKRTGGKRLFKMSPIHHHFEELGWSEWKIDFVFWAWGLFFTLSGLFFYLKGWKL
ncbi:MAG: phospho-N-acetylmuramoyl-pentapeptide-transferase [Firmicutes bacterium]|nr:phospho-N-acetylmuramoyl-pentapeptide-transferase [Bacillota bacterium]